ncbi:MAG: tetratricopeptide repeat protein, partial [Cyanobacteria bacterium J06628_4]
MTEPNPENLIRQTIDGDGNQPIGQVSGTAINQARDIYIGASPQPSYTSLHQLPRDIADFTGREQQIQQIEAGLTQTGTAVPIVAVAGMAGVGKSALAIHVAHRLKGTFPDAQLYADLRGADDRALAPGDVLVDWLRALGVDDGQIPPSLDGRTKLYRQQLEGKRVLVVLDNASKAEQVRPLLMGCSTCGVLITSRQRLAALAGAELVNLSPMAEMEALNLLQSLAGAERLQANDDMARRIVTLCGRLPLAVRIAGAFLRQKHHWSLGEYAKQIANEQQRLQQLNFDQWDVQASFNLSYDALGDDDRRLFQMMGVMPQDFGMPLVAGVMKSESANIKAGIERLIDAQLLEPLADQRYRYHDLMRLFALGKLTDNEKAQTQQSIIDWYVQGASFFDNALTVGRRKQTAEQLGVDEATFEQTALSWFEGERNNLLLASTWLKEQARYDQLSSFVSNLTNFFKRRSYWLDWVDTHELALDAARQTTNKTAEGQMLNNLGLVYDSQGRWDEAIQCYEQSLAVKRELGDRHGEAQTLNNLGLVYNAQGRWDEAIQCYEQS